MKLALLLSFVIILVFSASVEANVRSVLYDLQNYSTADSNLLLHDGEISVSYLLLCLVLSIAGFPSTDSPKHNPNP